MAARRFTATVKTEKRTLERKLMCTNLKYTCTYFIEKKKQNQENIPNYSKAIFWAIFHFVEVGDQLSVIDI